MHHGENAAELDELVRGGFSPMEDLVVVRILQGGDRIVQVFKAGTPVK